MAYLSEPSSSLSFTSSSHLSNGSITHNIPPFSVPETGANLEILSLTKLSSSLEQLIVDNSPVFSDADIVVEGVPVGVHRCILAVRSKFFDEVFKKGSGSSEKDAKPSYNMSELLPYGKIGLEAFQVFLSYFYTGKLKPSPMEVSTCVDNVCAHDACRPAINFAVELMYASSIFQIPELVPLFQRRLLNFVEKALVEDIIPILVVAFHCQCSQLVSQCVDRVARSDLDSICIEKELPYEVAESIRLLRRKSPSDAEDNEVVIDPLREKRIRRIHKALDSDDVELVKLLLTESDITLDDATALHYAAAYCDPKVVSEILGLRLADVNLRNSRGYTVLHIAVMRKEPSVIMSLLAKGAFASTLTLDGRSAVNICRRLTRPKDYHAKTEQGKETNKDRICIDVLEREMRRNPMAGDVSVTSHTLADDLHMRLLYLENRVALARLLFPSEAKLAIDIAHAETTSELANGNLRQVDLNETPIMQRKRLLARMESLMKTVEMGRRYFPHCSEVLDKFMEDDLPDLFYLETGPEEQKIERTRFRELKEDVQKAFNKDKAVFNRNEIQNTLPTLIKSHGVRRLKEGTHVAKAHLLVKNYLFADPLIPYTSILGGILACKVAYDLTQLISSSYSKTYPGLTKIQRVEWNNRGISTVHAVFISALSLYFVFGSNLFSDERAGLLVFRSSPLSTFGLGVSVGYFLSDLGMILWLYPSLGGIEYVIHHTLSGIAVAYSMLTGEAQLYTYMVLISEVTTPEINIRWYLDTAGMKRSTAYLINGVVIFLAWLIARVLLFGYMFYHVYLHYTQVIKMHAFGYMLVFGVPSVLAIMNLMWFGKIIKGVVKVLTKRR
ncbi:hypothetical protein V6N11_048634 [Hibiscus sabdariffa]|uniref:Uncharacterized protein n=1 Tax=Hibiscus sabdariffa TaxID=183260 RepID=A0ABR2PVT0_9ROSI